MPLSFKDFTDVLRSLPEGASQDQVNAAADAAEQGTPLEQLWHTVNKPLVGSEDALIPFARHTHGADEGVVRRTAEDFGASLTSPLNLGLIGLSGTANLAGKAGKFGISAAARATEGALQVPFVAEGVKQMVNGDSAGEKLGGAVEAGLGAVGVRSAATHAFDPGAVADTYMKERGFTRATDRPALNPDLSKRIADAYEALKHSPEDPAVRASYKALADEVSDQYRFLKERAGLKMEPWQDEGQPYANSAAMRADLGKNHLYYFPTKDGFGTGSAEDHPLLRPGVSGLPLNDELRAIHDYFGHGVNANEFGPKGEEAAWQDHRDMFSGAARGALTTETRGQNSWVNFGPHLRDAEGNLPKKGQPGFVPPAERPFAPQKAGLLSPELEDPRGNADFLKTREPYAILSAGNPAGKVLSEPENDALHQQLVTLLEQKGLKPITQQGHYGGNPEPSVFVQGLSPADAATIGRQFKQDAIITHEGWHRLGDDQKFPRTGISFDPGMKNNYSEIELPELGKRKYQFAFPDAIFDSASPAPTEAHTVSAAAAVAEGRTGAPSGPSLDGSTSDAARAGASMRQRLVQGPEEALRGLGTPEALGEAEKLRTANPDLFDGASKRAIPGALAIASPAASAGIDDSDPNDPLQGVKHYGKLALDTLGAAALGAALRKGEVPLQKQAAAHGAALLLLGEKPKVWEQRILKLGVDQADLPKVRAAAAKLLEQQTAKAVNGLPNTRKLVDTFVSGKGDMDWYKTTGELKHYFGKDADLVAQLIAATSSNATVKSNLTLALKAYSQLKANGMQPLEKGFLPAVVKQINAVAAGEGLQGRKVDAFARALMGDPDAVVVDRWMMRAFGYDKDIPTPAQYDLIEHTVRELAKKKGVEPRQMQAAIWFGVKQAAEEGKNRPTSPSYGTLLQQKLGTLPL